jgi:hypothetical protein
MSQLEPCTAKLYYGRALSQYNQTYLSLYHGYNILRFRVLAFDSVHSVRDILKHKIQIHLIRLHATEPV